MCKSQSNLQRVVSPWAVRAYLYVCRCIGKRFVISLPKIWYWMQYVTRNTDLSHLECDIVTLFTGWISSSVVASRQKRGVRDFCRPANSYEQVFIRTATSRAPYSSSFFYTLLFASSYMIKEGITKSLLDIPSLHNANNDSWRYLNVIARTPHSPKARCRLADSRLYRLQPSLLSLNTVRYNY